MNSRHILLILCLPTISSCQPWMERGMPDRHQPPPVASFLKNLHMIRGGADGEGPQEPGLKSVDRTTWWAQFEGARNQLSVLKSSIPGHRFPRHLLALSPVRGCHLGTCQIQNLADLLYRYGGNNQKDESHKNNKGTADPMGYGRRKRRAAGHGVHTPT